MSRLYNTKIIITILIILIGIMILIYQQKLNMYEKIVKNDIKEDYYTVLTYLVELEESISLLKSGNVLDSKDIILKREQALLVSGTYDRITSKIEMISNSKEFSSQNERLSVFISSFFGELNHVYTDIKQGSITTETMNSLEEKEEILRLLVLKIKNSYNDDKPTTNIDYKEIKNVIVELNNILNEKYFGVS